MAETLYISEAECARRLGFSIDRWRSLAPAYERLGMPRADAVAKRRYWPAIKAFHDRHNGMTGPDAIAAFLPPDGKEAGNGFKAKNSRRSRPGANPQD
jgi:hypothetical protein